MSLQTVMSLAWHAMHPRRLLVMARKALVRINDIPDSISKTELNTWLKRQCVSIEDFAKQLHPELWEEARQYSNTAISTAEEKLQSVPMSLGGGGASTLLYFLARLTQPKVVVETGVAAGFSSTAFLTALDRNGLGHLYSSDFPYFRVYNSERYIGFLVPEALKNRWTLLIAGDTNNLPHILKMTTTIDLFHYDSDKSYRGRAFAMQILTPAIKKTSLIIIDDIQDNSHFYDYCNAHPELFWKIFFFEGKYLGLLSYSNFSTLLDSKGH